METFLNLAWAGLALAGVCTWLRIEKRAGAQRRLPLLALAMLIVILFPVISVSDDLWSLQNPAEMDTCQRRDHLGGRVHAVFPGSAAIPEPVFAQLSLGFTGSEILFYAPVLFVDTSALSEIESRPPPVA
ncbi:MAG: hypothetical protein WCC26_15395 [Terracidiphilus sp.]